ncbi:MAG: Zn-ribbon domain-containing OB-fold protein [Candidatus Eisenbacteria bacterium]|uniref:Zn-ribbon domain-containing OB-fold protein n=1 Tax=Eiseniibacteriota bacterium TaxID=2212470 RepID=A0A937X7E6_UNCEI|nr:Zn-ribbon domain-containing OB-fold protein [Candidatus Eisenbacteria bacterium]
MPPARAWRNYPQLYRLEAARCTKCGTVHFPPRLVCSHCRNRSFETFRLGRTGQLVSYTVIRTPSAEFTGQAPFAVGIVEMDDRVRLTAQVVDVGFDELRVGLPVRLEFRRISAEGESGVIHYGYKAAPVRG